MEGESGQGQGSGQEQGSEQQGEQGKGQAGKGTEESFDKDRAMATIKAQRESETTLKEQLREAQTKLKEHEDAKLSESEKLTNRLAETERNTMLLETQLQEERLDRSIERVASRMQFADPEDAVHLVDRSLISIGKDGKPDAKSLEAALKALASAKPHLVGTGRPGSWDGGARKSSPAGSDMNAIIREAAGIG